MNVVSLSNVNNKFSLTIEIKSCEDCMYKEPGIGDDILCGLTDSNRVYEQNKNNLTATCPLVQKYLSEFKE